MSSEWLLDAACRGVEPELFFPYPYDIRSHNQIIDTYCGKCPVRDRCLETALSTADQHGIWGGTTALDRYRLRGVKT